MTIEVKKLQLITEITLLNDEVILEYYAQILSQVKQMMGQKMPTPPASKAKLPIPLTDVIRPMRDVIDLEALKKEQNWKPTTREEVRKIALAMNIQESYEDLLKMI